MAGHPFDPLSASELEDATRLVRKSYGSDLKFNVVSLQEPRKTVMRAWLADPKSNPKPPRVADVVVIDNNATVHEGLVDLDQGKVLAWDKLEGEQPIITLEEQQKVEQICREDPEVIKQCEISGMLASDMHKIYCDTWVVGYDERWGISRRLQQALMYYRPTPDSFQYQYALDFCPLYDPDLEQIVHIDIPKVRRPLRKDVPPIGYTPADVQKLGGYRDDMKPIIISQPEGVSFSMNGRELSWQNWKMHVGFNYKEGIVLNNIRWKSRNESEDRGIFYRMSLAEMVVPYAEPEPPHHRKHAFDFGEYGAGYMTNSLALGCDCKGAIHYIDAEVPTRNGGVRLIENAICIHEEDSGILFKHTDFRDDSVVVTRGRKLVIQQIFTAANYEYAIQWIFHQDGTIQPEIKLTGILNTYVQAPGENCDWGTQVYPGVNAHFHQHLFCLRLDANIDDGPNTVYTSDTMASDEPVGSLKNPYGNAFFAKKTKLSTTGQAKTDYDAMTMRSWDIVNDSKINSSSGKPSSYKLVSREVPRLLPKEGSLVWKRAGFARHHVYVTKYRDDQLWPAGRHVPQTSGEPSRGLPEWIGDGSESVENEDVVLWHTFGLTHIPAPEDFPVMPAEPVTLLLRPRHFFDRNPALDVPPSYLTLPSQIEKGERTAAYDATDKMSKPAFGGEEKTIPIVGGGGGCCSKL
ncbi:peroxisomal copper amine oxidase [Zalerion maritima]|uniref:Amine oxidase n=1 Tax=Zalerion maritima TaxID=339359 RepID=A0AAD5WP01_9PEZI|nr:peroxisomal copper amine oxidase [Zalerion maritima]